MEDTDDTGSENMGIHKPELGIFDSREWEAIHRQWLEGKGAKPGKHPDPNCDWNKNPELFDSKDY